MSDSTDKRENNENDFLVQYKRAIMESLVMHRSRETAFPVELAQLVADYAGSASTSTIVEAQWQRKRSWLFVVRYFLYGHYLAKSALSLMTSAVLLWYYGQFVRTHVSQWQNAATFGTVFLFHGGAFKAVFEVPCMMYVAEFAGGNSLKIDRDAWTFGLRKFNDAFGMYMTVQGLTLLYILTVTSWTAIPGGVVFPQFGVIGCGALLAAGIWMDEGGFNVRAMGRQQQGATGEELAGTDAWWFRNRAKLTRLMTWNALRWQVCAFVVVANYIMAAMAFTVFVTKYHWTKSTVYAYRADHCRSFDFDYTDWRACLIMLSWIL